MASVSKISHLLMYVFLSLLSSWHAESLYTIASNNPRPPPPLSTISVRGDRRTFLATAAVAACAAPVLVHPAASPRAIVSALDATCNRRFLRTVAGSSYHFLYRGLDPGVPLRSSSPTIRREEPGLLDPSTCGDVGASNFFASLERSVAAEGLPLRPSAAHLGKARSWDRAVSACPLGEDVHYAWYRGGGRFSPPAAAAPERTLIVDGVKCGEVGLDDALALDASEVMFSAQRWMVVPAELDGELRKELARAFLV